LPRNSAGQLDLTPWLGHNTLLAWPVLPDGGLFLCLLTGHNDAGLCHLIRGW